MNWKQILSNLSTQEFAEFSLIFNQETIRRNQSNSADSVCHIASNGDIVWLDNKGRFHKIGGPAIEYVNGSREYYHHGLRHNLDGPAVIHSDGYKEYWVNGKFLREEDFNKVYAN